MLNHLEQVSDIHIRPLEVPLVVAVRVDTFAAVCRAFAVLPFCFRIVRLMGYCEMDYFACDIRALDFHLALKSALLGFS